MALLAVCELAEVGADVDNSEETRCCSVVGGDASALNGSVSELGTIALTSAGSPPGRVSVRSVIAVSQVLHSGSSLAWSGMEGTK